MPRGAGSEDTIALHLFVVPGSADAAAARKAVEEAVAGLPSYQRPQAIHLVDDMPRTETGKLRRGVLGRMLE